MTEQTLAQAASDAEFNRGFEARVAYRKERDAANLNTEQRYALDEIRAAKRALEDLLEDVKHDAEDGLAVLVAGGIPRGNITGTGAISPQTVFAVAANTTRLDERVNFASVQGIPRELVAMALKTPSDFRG